MLCDNKLLKMNCRCKRSLLSVIIYSHNFRYKYFRTGAFSSARSLFFLDRKAHLKLIDRQIITACQEPSFKNSSIPITFGQPTHLTHPHRIKKGEIVPGITLEEIKLRRDRLVENIKSYCFHRDFGNKTLIIVIPSSCKKYMTEKIPYVFRQNSDFLYLTGCLEQDCLLVLTVEGNKDESIIFVRGKDPQSELWDGPRTGVDQAVKLFGVDKAMPMKEFEFFIECFMKENKDCILWYDYLNDVHPVVHKLMKQFLTSTWNKVMTNEGGFFRQVWESPKRFIHQLRLYKSPAEQELMKKSCQIASQAIINTMKDSRPWDNEAFIQARVDFHCRMNGAEYLAYPPVVASGDRANTIHYIENNQVVKEGDLVLMDAGCEYHGYCSDISRTWPISGKFSPAQRVLYEVVYSVQTDLIQMCCQFPTLDQLYIVMKKLLGIRLKDSGVMLHSVEEDTDKCASSFCPHHVSHYLGMDVHDTSTVFRHVPLEPGMVCTIEPGVYISKNNKFANSEYHGLGIRIEDDILMTNSGPLVLSSSCPKHPDDIEQLRT